MNAVRQKTPKEWTLSRIYELRNEVALLEKGKPLYEDMELAFSSRQFERELTRGKLYDMRAEHEELKAKVLSLKERKERIEKAEAYFETDEGKKVKEDLEAQIEALRANHDKELNDLAETVKAKAQEILGSHWTTQWPAVNTSGCVVTLVLQKEGKRVFGCDIEIRYEADRWKGYDKVNQKQIVDEVFETNVGTCGGFALIDDDIYSRAAFYRDLGTLLSNREALEYIRDYMRSTWQQKVKDSDKYRRLNHRLENPLSE